MGKSNPSSGIATLDKEECSVWRLENYSMHHLDERRYMKVNSMFSQSGTRIDTDAGLIQYEFQRRDKKGFMSRVNLEYCNGIR